MEEAACLQIMPRAQLPALTSTMMIAQALLAAPAGIRAKHSIKARNTVLLLGYAAMIAADLSFAFLTSVPGLPSPQSSKSHTIYLYDFNLCRGSPFA